MRVYSVSRVFDKKTIETTKSPRNIVFFGILQTLETKKLPSVLLSFRKLSDVDSAPTLLYRVSQKVSD